MNPELIALQKASLKSMETVSSCEQSSCSKQADALQRARQTILHNTKQKSFQGLNEDLKRTKEMKRLAACSVKNCKKDVTHFIKNTIASYESECKFLKAKSLCDKSKAISSKPQSILDNYIHLKR